MNWDKARSTAVAVWLFAVAWTSVSEDVGSSRDLVVTFAKVESARQVLTNRDEFIKALSPFDRAARMKVDRTVTEDEFLKFVGEAARSWSPQETNQVSAVLRNIQRKLAPWNLPFPRTVQFIKTSGVEEGYASYTRQDAIVLCEKEIQSPESGLERLITHELFHILSRHDAILRKDLYRIVGFSAINEIAYPADLAGRRITNPDGVQTSWAITITNRSQRLSVVPILFSSAPSYSTQKGGEFFEYLTFKLLVVTNNGVQWQPSHVGGRPHLLEPLEAEGFSEQIGMNTSYIIHPDEILADNFVHMVNENMNVVTPRIVEEMKEVFTRR